MLDGFFTSLIPTTAVGQAIGTLWVVLGGATVLILVLRSRFSEALNTELLDRMRSWLAILATLTIAFSLGETVTILMFALIAYLALKEYLTAIPIRRADRRVLLLGYLMVPIQFIFILIGWYGLFSIFIPVYGFLLLSIGLILSGETKGFIRSVGMLHWGLILTVYNLSHLAGLLVLDDFEKLPLDGFGLLLFVLIVVQFNDVAQYIWGKLFGKRKIAPAISPGKTWEGFLLGGATTIVLAIILSPILTPFSLPMSILMGFGLAVTGFFGDVTLSAVKRDIGIKDLGEVLPGHGGYLDRLDSLTLSAPLFFHLVRFYYGA